eukprot:Em0010g845a
MSKEQAVDARGAKKEVVVSATFKVLVLGDSSVGKTSVISRYATGDVPLRLIATIGMDFSDIVVSAGGTKVKLRVWDTAGQEKFHTFTKQFFRGTQGILLVYDVTKMDTFHTLKRWVCTIYESGLEKAKTVMLGNKADLQDLRQVPRRMAEELAQQYGFDYLETSCVSGLNIKEAFRTLAEKLVVQYEIFLPGQLNDSSTSSTSTSPTQHVSSVKLQHESSIKLHLPSAKPRKTACCNKS